MSLFYFNKINNKKYIIKYLNNNVKLINNSICLILKKKKLKKKDI